MQKFAGSDFRWLIFQDAWPLIRSSPWVGLGLGNFESVFAIFRDASRGTTRSLHPESDWFWVWSEMGWLAIPLIILGALLLIRRVAPLEVGTNQRFRLAALIGALALTGLGIEPLGTTPREFADYLRSEIAQWSAVVRRHNIRAD